MTNFIQFDKVPSEIPKSFATRGNASRPLRDTVGTSSQESPRFALAMIDILQEGTT